MSSTDDAQVVVKPKPNRWWWVLAGLAVLGLAVGLLASPLGRRTSGTSAPSPYSFSGVIREIQENGVLIEPGLDDPIRRSGDKVWVSTANLPDIGAGLDSLVTVFYDGTVMESYPLQVRPIDWELVRFAPH